MFWELNRTGRFTRKRNWNSFYTFQLWHLSCYVVTNTAATVELYFFFVIDTIFNFILMKVKLYSFMLYNIYTYYLTSYFWPFIRHQLNLLTLYFFRRKFAPVVYGDYGPSTTIRPEAGRILKYGNMMKGVGVDHLFLRTSRFLSSQHADVLISSSANESHSDLTSDIWNCLLCKNSSGVECRYD